MHRLRGALARASAIPTRARSAKLSAPTGGLTRPSGGASARAREGGSTLNPSPEMSADGRLREGLSSGDRARTRVVIPLRTGKMAATTAVTMTSRMNGLVCT